MYRPFFNSYHIKCRNGGQANLVASTTDFGDKALVADGRSSTPIFTASATNGETIAPYHNTITIDAPTPGINFGALFKYDFGCSRLMTSTYEIISATQNISWMGCGC